MGSIILRLSWAAPSALFSVAALVTALFLVAGPVAAQPVKAYFAGVAVIGDFAQNEEAFPYTSALLRERDAAGMSLVNAAVAKRLGGVTNVDLRSGDLGDYKKGDGISLALAIDWENVSLERVGGDTKIVVDVHAQILIFDFTSMKVIGAYPVAVQVRDVQEGEATPDHVRRIVNDIFFKPGPANLLDRFAERLREVAIKETYGNRIRVASVTLGAAADEALATHGVERGVFQAFVAQSFGKFLSSNQNVPILPYTKGQAIGSTMAARFANGDVYQLQIPEADYSVDIDLQQFKKVKVAENAAETAWLYGVYAQVRVAEPVLATNFLDGLFKFGVVKQVPRGVTPADWPAYQEAVLSMFDQLTHQISARDGKWLGKWAVTAAVDGQLTQVESVLARCR